MTYNYLIKLKQNNKEIFVIFHTKNKGQNIKQLKIAQYERLHQEQLVKNIKNPCFLLQKDFEFKSSLNRIENNQ